MAKIKMEKNKGEGTFLANKKENIEKKTTVLF